MTAVDWDPSVLRSIDASTELQISSQRADGSDRPFIQIWHAAVGGRLYIRSARGPDNGWFRRALIAGVGRIRAGGMTHDVAFELAEPAIHTDLDAALHAKYDRFGPGPIGAITGDDVLETTLLVSPLA